jgi:hypothetical protein
MMLVLSACIGTSPIENKGRSLKDLSHPPKQCGKAVVRGTNLCPIHLARAIDHYRSCLAGLENVWFDYTGVKFGEPIPDELRVALGLNGGDT